MAEADDISPRVAESVPVVLARMEGTLLRISDRVGDLTPRVDKIEGRLKVQEDLTLTLTKNAEAEEARKVAIALALKESDETRRNQSELSWTPFQRLMTVIACVVGVAGLVILYFSQLHH